LKKITLKELAKILGVSIATVSKSLNDSHEISLKTKLRIQEAAKKYNYSPNELALNLKSGTTKTIGVLLPSILEHFSAKLYCGIEKISSANGYTILVYTSSNSLEKEIKNIDKILKKHIDGFIVSLTDETISKGVIDHLDQLINSGKPVVMVDNIIDVACHKVVIDDYSEAYNSISNLLKLDGKNILVLSSTKTANIDKEKIKGVIDALKNSFHIKSYVVFKETENVDIKEFVLNKIRNEQIDAIITLDKETLFETYQVLQMQMQKIELIGFSDQKILKQLFPSFTSIHRRGKFLGEIATQMLIENIEGKSPTKHYNIVKINSLQKTILE